MAFDESAEGEIELSGELTVQLVRLHEQDIEIRRREQLLQFRPAELEAKQRELVEAKQEVQDSKDLQKAAQARVDAKNVEIEALKGEVLKLEGQLFSLKTNDEFNAMKAQIANKKKKDSKLQDNALELMMSMDDLIPVHEDKVRAAEKVDKECKELAQAVADEVKRLNGEVAKAEEERKQLFESLPEELRDLYAHVAGRRDGVAVTAIENEICMGCHTRVKLQDINRVMGGKLTQCPHCDRILFLRARLD